MIWSPVTLLVTDETSPHNLTNKALTRVGFQVIMASDVGEAVSLTRSHAPECIIIDTSHKGADEQSALVRLRNASEGYMIALYDPSKPSEAADMLREGADMYLAKPVDDTLLDAVLDVARRHAANQRSPMQMDARRYGDLLINFSRGKVQKGDTHVELTATEFRLLRALVTRNEQTVSHDELLTRVWGSDSNDRTHYVRIYVNRLRKKIEDDPSRPRYIITELGEGYRFKSRGD